MQAFHSVFLLIIVQLLAGTAAAQTHSDWPTLGGAAGGGQYSSLNQINASNLDRLNQEF
jgi:glucose dehydrogenase